MKKLIITATLLAEDPFTARRLERGTLGSRVLFVGRNACVLAHGLNSIRVASRKKGQRFFRVY